MQTMPLFQFDEVSPQLGHPAKFSECLYPTFVRMLRGATCILDPFAGAGGIFDLAAWYPDAEFQGTELEPEWAALHRRTTQGSALALPWPDGYFDAILTSPCLAHGHRILRRDLRWIRVEDIKVGDEIISFDDVGDGVTKSGNAKRRKWRIGTILRSITRKVECVKVTLSNGESVTCTPEHPWLAQPFASGGNATTGHMQWVQAKDLISPSKYMRRTHGKWMKMPKKPNKWWVHKQLDVWEENKSYNAGWLAGIMDGEGSLSFGDHGSPKLMITQVDGMVSNLIYERLDKLGIPYSTIQRKSTPSHRQPITNTYINGGFPGILKTLGTLRPERLIEKLGSLNVASRSIEANEKVQVVSVEPVGLCDIQEIETSTGTYIGDGYLHHNCYGNRMADRLLNNKWVYHTYAAELGRNLSPGSGAALQWGPAYRDLHLKAWTEAWRVLRTGSRFILNIKDHIRNGKRQMVTDWHIETLESLGFVLQDHHKDFNVPGLRDGENYDLRIEYESVILFHLGGPDAA